MSISPQIRFAVERARDRAKKQAEEAGKQEESFTGVSLQGEAWRSEVELLEDAIDILKSLE